MSPFQNVASGNAHVGFQIGQNTGTVNLGDAAVPGPLRAELDSLRAAVRAADLGADERAEAEHEIEVARAALAGADTGRATRALRRLTGMTHGIAGFGALAGSVIAAIEGLAS